MSEHPGDRVIPKSRHNLVASILTNADLTSLCGARRWGTLSPCDASMDLPGRGEPLVCGADDLNPPFGLKPMASEAKDAWGIIKEIIWININMTFSVTLPGWLKNNNKNKSSQPLSCGLPSPVPSERDRTACQNRREREREREAGRGIESERERERGRERNPLPLGVWRAQGNTPETTAK